MNQVTSNQSQEGTTNKYDKAQKHTKTKFSSFNQHSVLYLPWVGSWRKECCKSSPAKTPQHPD